MSQSPNILYWDMHGYTLKHVGLVVRVASAMLFLGSLVPGFLGCVSIGFGRIRMPIGTCSVNHGSNRLMIPEFC